MREEKGKKRKSLLFGVLTLAFSLTLFFHILSLRQEKNEVEISITLTAMQISPELGEQLEKEDTLSLDGRFPLLVTSCTASPSLLRFYDGERACEFTVPSKKYSDYQLTLTAKARAHEFGYALGGVRTVNVGMGVTLFGKTSKIYGTISALKVISDV